MYIVRKQNYNLSASTDFTCFLSSNRTFKRKKGTDLPRKKKESRVDERKYEVKKKEKNGFVRCELGVEQSL